jgi:hypothetical protein
MRFVHSSSPSRGVQVAFSTRRARQNASPAFVLLGPIFTSLVSVTAPAGEVSKALDIPQKNPQRKSLISRCADALLGTDVRLGLGMEVDPQTGSIHVKFFTGEPNSFGRNLQRFATALLGPALRKEQVETAFSNYVNDRSTDPYFVKMARAFDFSIGLDKESESRLTGILSRFGSGSGKPKGLVIAAKHTSNGAETMALAALVESLIAKLPSDKGPHPSVKVALTNALESVPGLPEHSILIDISGSPNAKANNRLKREQMLAHVAQGGVLILHPSATVAVPDPLTTVYSEPTWRKGVSMILAQNPGASVMLASFDHQASDEYSRLRSIPWIGQAISPVLHVRESARNRIWINCSNGPKRFLVARYHRYCPVTKNWADATWPSVLILISTPLMAWSSSTLSAPQFRSCSFTSPQPTFAVTMRPMVGIPDCKNSWPCPARALLSPDKTGLGSSLLTRHRLDSRGG